MLRIARQHIFKAIVVAGFFDEGALQGVHRQALIGWMIRFHPISSDFLQHHP
jgi:hypothetical protein